MTVLALALLGALFTSLLVRGYIKREMPSKFGTAILAREPKRYYFNAALIAFFAVLCFAAAALQPAKSVTQPQHAPPDKTRP